MFNLIVRHGENPEIVHFLIDLVHANEQNNVFIKQSVLMKLFSPDYLPHFKVRACDKILECYPRAAHQALQEKKPAREVLDNIANMIDGEVHFYSFTQSVDIDTYELLLVCLLGTCIDRKAGINFISKCFELYPFDLLIESFRYRLEKSESLDMKDKLVTYFEKATRLVDTFVSTFEKSFLEFLVVDKNEENILAIFRRIQSLMEVGQL